MNNHIQNKGCCLHNICVCILYMYYVYIIRHTYSIYTEQKYKRNTFVFAPIFHELNSTI